MQVEDTAVKNNSKRDRYLLTKEYAYLRSKCIQNISYTLSFKFEHFSDFYEVEAIIEFDIIKPFDLILECGAHSIKEMEINSHKLSNNEISSVWKDNSLTIIPILVKIGRNKIKIVSKSRFSRDSSGFHSFTDTESINHQYCYTVGPPNYAHRIYPCFDQPDLKAYFTLKVTAPDSWVIIGNTPVIKEEEMNGNKNWEFEKTPLISTYLFSIAAGNYRKIAYKKTTKVPLAIYLTEKRYFPLLNQADEIFELIDAAINFYENFFQIPFPFKKYDQVFCPEFKYLGMENPGMALIIENYAFMSRISPYKIAARALTFVHELSHMWFGNYATMKWWDDIWLNEGFATFIAYYTLPLIEKKSAFQNLDVKFLFYKQEALDMDAFESSHPVEQVVKDTEDASTIFDDITYCKSSGVIKHLMFLLGEEVFAKCLNKYFKQFAWKNSESNDFFRVIEENSVNLKKETISKWVKDWIRTEGKITLEPTIEIKGNTLNLSIRKANSLKRITTNKTVDINIKVLTKLNNKLHDISFQRITLEDELTEVSIDSKTPLSKDNIAVVLNYNDHAYADVIFDDISLNFLMDNSEEIEPLVRGQMFLSMVSNVKAAKLNPIILFDWIANEIRREKIFYLNSEYLGFASRLVDYYLPQEVKKDCCAILFDALVESLKECNNQNDVNSEDHALLIQEYIVNFAFSHENILLLQGWVKREIPSLQNLTPSGIFLGRLFEEVIFRSEFSPKEKEQFLDMFISNHPYYSNLKKGALATFEEKCHFWEKFLKFDSSDSSHYAISCIMKGFNNPHDKNCEYFAKKFFEDVLYIFKNCEYEYANVFFNNLFPKISNVDLIIEEVEKLLKTEENLFNLKPLLEEKLYQTKIRKSLEKFHSKK